MDGPFIRSLAKTQQVSGKKAQRVDSEQAQLAQTEQTDEQRGPHRVCCIRLHLLH